MAATKMDPTLQMVHTCGYLAGLDIDVHLKASGRVVSTIDLPLFD